VHVNLTYHFSVSNKGLLPGIHPLYCRKKILYLEFKQKTVKNSFTMSGVELTSTTAPGKVFASRSELADHYKSDWHKYNLKRREAGLPLLLEADFNARLAAALSLRQGQEEERNGTSHLKKGKKQKQKNKNNNKNVPSSGNGVVAKSQAAAYDKMKEDDADKNDETKEEENETMETDELENEQHAMHDAEKEDGDDDIVIDPKQCLFDHHFSASVEANVDRMYRKYGLFVPDREFLTDLEGLVGYCHEKIKLGHMW
jgi:pre-60S factor REI1